MSRRRCRFDSVAWERAHQAFSALDPEVVDDATLMEAIVDCLLASGPPFLLAIVHDVRPSTAKRIARCKKIGVELGRELPDWAYSRDPIGPCPLRWDWQRKNIIGIETMDREEARAWAVEAMLAGYCVYHHTSISGSGSGNGSLAQARKRLRERRHVWLAEEKWRLEEDRRRKMDEDFDRRFAAEKAARARPKAAEFSAEQQAAMDDFVRQHFGGNDD